MKLKLCFLLLSITISLVHAIDNLSNYGGPDNTFRGRADSQEVVRAVEKAQDIIDRDVNLNKFPALKKLVEKVGNYFKA